MKKVLFNFIDGKKEISIGDVCYYSHKNTDTIVKDQITKIGRKYITTSFNKGFTYRYEIETGVLVSDYGQITRLFSSLEAIKNFKKREKLFDVIQQFFKTFNLKKLELHDLEKIHESIEPHL